MAGGLVDRGRRPMIPALLLSAANNGVIRSKAFIKTKHLD